MDNSIDAVPSPSTPSDGAWAACKNNAQC